MLKQGSGLKKKTRKEINTCTMMYHSVTVPFSQFRIPNFNTDIDEYSNKKGLKIQKQINVFFFIILQNMLLVLN